VDILVSGCQVDIELPFEVQYRLNGLCFIFGKRGGIDYVDTYRRGKLKKMYKEIQQLPVENYDLVISDFEPVSAWACYYKNIRCIGLSHQAAVIHERAPRPKKSDLIGEAVLKYYAPCSVKLGFHYQPYDQTIFTPIIRKEVRDLSPTNKGHYTVYLPAYSDNRIIKMLNRFPEVKWDVYSKHTKSRYFQDDISVSPIDNEAFLKSMASAEGVLCGAGFQTPAEAIFLNKKLMVIPMKGQYEQQCNAAALQQMSIPVLKNLKKKRVSQIREWLSTAPGQSFHFPDISEHIIQLLLQEAAASQPERSKVQDGKKYDSFRQLVLRKVFHHPQKQ
jgi:uncharacterized protein (TIGR00661 family)